MEANNSKGFTLFELIIVLFIVGLVSTLALPRMFNSLTHVELKNAARKTVVLLNRSRDIAYFQRITVWVRFDPNKNQITVLQKDPLQKEVKKIIDGMGYTFPEGVTLQAENVIEIMYSSTGTSTGGSFLLQNQRGRGYRIHVDIVTGRAEIIN